MMSVPHLAGSDLLLSIALGVGLAAAVGLRVFLPMLVLSIAAHTGHVPLSNGFAWLASTAALIMLSVAALLEVLAYYVPGVDNLLDVLATPAAIVAGIVVSAAVMTEPTPMVKWSTALIAGGGAAGLTQGLSALVRAKSTLLTGGLGNHVLSSFELCGSLLLALLALFAPLAAVAIVAIGACGALRVMRRLTRAPKAAVAHAERPRSCERER
jgi:Domain of unknown function (DUF4126)